MNNSISSLFYLLYCPLIGLLLCASCSNDRNKDQSPTISLIGISKDRMNQGSLGLKDTLIVNLSFSDTDGDLSGIQGNIVIIDNRNGEIHFTNTIPNLPDAKQGNVGTMQLSIPTLCCIFDDGTPACEAPPNMPTNQLTFDIYVIDAAGHESNRVTTPQIELVCN